MIETTTIMRERPTFRITRMQPLTKQLLIAARQNDRTAVWITDVVRIRQAISTQYFDRSACNIQTAVPLQSAALQAAWQKFFIITPYLPPQLHRMSGEYATVAHCAPAGKPAFLLHSR